MSEWIVEVKDAVERALAALFDNERARFAELAPEGRELVEQIESFTMRGGKRLRPAITFAAYRSVDPRGSMDAVASCGVALELLQSYLLIHDDWMDGDDERRGGPSVHASLRTRHD